MHLIYEYANDLNRNTFFVLMCIFIFENSICLHIYTHICIVERKIYYGIFQAFEKVMKML